MHIKTGCPHVHRALLVVRSRLIVVCDRLNQYYAYIDETSKIKESFLREADNDLFRAYALAWQELKKLETLCK